MTNRQILWQQTFYEELSSEPSAPTGVPKMSLLAGIPSAIGNQDGQKVNAYYSNISGFAIDANGEIIFADNKNNNIRKIAKNGSISTLAGGGLTQTELDGLRTGSNYVDGKGSVARFHNPKNLVLDSIGNIYVNDNINKIIRKIDIAGNVTTLAGKVGECDLSAIKNPTQFCDVSSMAIDSAGNIYAAEGNSAIGNPIKKISVSGDMATIVEKASIYPTGWVNMDTIMYKYLPVHLGVDAQGSVYAADPNDRVIRKYVNGALELFSGAEVKNNIGYVDGLAAEVKFSYIAGIAFDKKNNFYVLDNNRIRKVGVDGSVTTTLDLSNACSVADGQINSTKNCWFDNLAIDDNGHFLVQESGSQPSFGISYNAYSVLRQFSLDGTSSIVAGKAPAASLVDGNADMARFFNPETLTITPSGIINLWDHGNGVIRRISESGQTSTWGTPEKTCEWYDLVTPEKPQKIQELGNCRFDQLTSDKNNNIYASRGAYIVKISPNGDVSLFSNLTSYSQFKDYFTSVKIQGMAFAEDGVMYASYATGDFSEAQKSAIFKITSTGEVSLFAGSLTAAGHRDGRGGDALFKKPKSLALDSKGNLYVLDDTPMVSSNILGPTVRKITPSGQVTTLAGQANAAPGLVDGNAKQAVFTFSYSKLSEGHILNANLALDAQDNLYVTDPEHSVIRKITPAGQVSTLVGTAGVHGFLGGDLPGVINRPVGVAVYKDELYFSMRSAVGKINLK